MKKILFVFPILLLLVGCMGNTITINKVVLLPEDRIFTIPAGQEISVELDKKPMKMIFPQDMKLVSPSFLVRQEENLNNAMYKSVKTEETRNKYLGIIGSICAILAGIVFWLKSRSVKKST